MGRCVFNQAFIAMTLFDLGWNAHWASQLDALALSAPHPARVVQHDRTRYLVQDGDGVRSAVLPGRTLSDPEADRPAVGDWVVVQGDDDLAVIQALLPRRTAFSRKVPGETTREQVIAANLDVVFVVMGLDGDFNLRRLERFVSQAWSSGATPVVLLNKADLCDDVEGRRASTSWCWPRGPGTGSTGCVRWYVPARPWSSSGRRAWGNRPSSTSSSATSG